MERTPAACSVVIVLAVASATALTEVSFALGVELSFEWYLVAVACVAWGCGKGAAVVTAIISCAVADFAFLPFHDFSFAIGVADAVRLAVFVGVATLIANLVAARRVAEGDVARRERLLATAAHELSNAIFALRTWTSVVGNHRPQGDEEARGFDDAARALTRTTRAIGKLAGDLMDWSRVSGGVLDLSESDFDLADVARDAFEELGEEARRRGLALSISVAPARVRADRDRLHQVVLNLLTNALRATRTGDQVSIAVHSTDHHACLSVRDTGRGIPADVLPKLFELGGDRAAPVDPGLPPPLPTSERGGLGLGLALSRRLVRAHCGEITAHSDGPGTGATFSVVLPAAPAAASVGGHAA